MLENLKTILVISWFHTEMFCFPSLLDELRSLRNVYSQQSYSGSNMQIFGIRAKTITILNLRGGMGVHQSKSKNPTDPDYSQKPTFLQRWLKLNGTNEADVETRSRFSSESGEKREKLSSEDESSECSLESRKRDAMLRFAGLILTAADQCMRNADYDEAFQNYRKACKLWRRTTSLIPADVLMYYGMHAVLSL